MSLPWALALLLGGCAAAAALPADAVVLPGSAVATIFQQCSRGAPAPGEASWQPGEDEIAALEAALPAALAARPEGRELADAPNGWLRQYVGIVRGGRRFVYGNFFPRSVTHYGDAGRWRREPVMVCDGGPAFFGIEYDVENGTFTQLGFNGLA